MSTGNLITKQDIFEDNVRSQIRIGKDLLLSKVSDEQKNLKI